MSKKLLVARYKGNVYEVYGDDIKISFKDDGDDTVVIDNAKVIYNGKECDGFGENFQGHMFNSNEVACDLVRWCINADQSIDFDPNFMDKDIFNACLKFDESESRYIIRYKVDGKKRTRAIPMVYLGLYGVLKLQMINKDYASYYSDGSEFVIIAKDGSLATDYEFLYGNSFIEDIENKNYLYLDKSINPDDFV